MDQTMSYANILEQVMREEGKLQPSFQPGLKIVSSCDSESGQYLLILIGWDKNEWHHTILFHAQLIGGKIIIETDMTEGLKPQLIEAGIRPEDFLSEQETYAPKISKMAA